VSRPFRSPTPLAPERAWDYALSLLGQRARTAAEMRERLRRRSLPDAETERVVERLEELGLLDDRAFAEAYVRTRAESRGRLGLRRELQRKGLAEEVVDDALAERTDDDEARAAVALLRKQAWRFRAAHEDDRERAAAARSRAYALLARRGFPPDAARGAVEAVLGAHDDE
jgi:regulatory protein